MFRTKSDELFAKSNILIPGGVNSPVRAFRSVSENPLFISQASGSRIFDIDGNKYIDYVASWGPLILGHAHPGVVEAVQKATAAGTSFGAPTEAELQLAGMVNNIIPACEMLRLVNSGTEATMHALRLARAATGREKIVKLAGCYHGASDSLLVRAGSGVETLGLPDSPGVPPALAELTLTADFNDIASIEKLFELFPQDIVCVILEPVMGNMGVVPPQDGFLQSLRTLCDKSGSLLIFDEVMTGFRIARGGAVERYGVTPDLMTYGKVIGGGLPVGAYGGRREIMEQIAPAGPVYQAGTLSGNPLATAAGLATLEALGEDGVYETLEKRSQHLVDGFQKAAQDAGLELSFNRVGSMQSVFFTSESVTGYNSAKSCNTGHFAIFFSEMLKRGIALAPSQFEAAFVSLAHSEEDIDATVAAAAEAFREVARQSQ